MTIADTSVKWFHSEMADAPVLSGTAGSLINLLDACLLDGFSSRVADSLVVADGVATVTLSAGNPYEKHAVIEISGALPAELNRQWRIASATPTALTFVVDDVVAAGSATGTIMVKRASAGWVKPFSDTNRAVYQSPDLESTQLYLYLDDTDPRYTRVRGYENVTDIDTREGPFPTLAQLALTNMTWAKSNQANATTRRWVVIADGSFMWVMPAFNASYSAVRTPHNFGDMIPTHAADAYHCMVTAHTTASPSNPGAAHPGTLMATVAPPYVARAANQAGSAVPIFSPLSGAFGYLPNYAPTKDSNTQALIGGEIVLQSGTATTSEIRGVLPGVKKVFQSDLGMSDLEIVDASGKVFMCVTVALGTLNQTAGVPAIFDITGPWR